MKNTKGFVWLPILLFILAGVIVISGGAYYVMDRSAQTQGLLEPIGTQTAPTGYKMVHAETLGMSFAIPQSWNASSTSAGGANFVSPDLAFVKTDPSDPTSELCIAKGNELSISIINNIDSSLQNPATFTKFYSDNFSATSNGSLDSGLPAPNVDAVVVGKFSQPEGLAPGCAATEFWEEANILKGGKVYAIDSNSVISAADTRVVLATFLATLQ